MVGKVLSCWKNSIYKKPYDLKNKNNKKLLIMGGLVIVKLLIMLQNYISVYLY